MDLAELSLYCHNLRPVFPSIFLVLNYQVVIIISVPQFSPHNIQKLRMKIGEIAIFNDPVTTLLAMSVTTINLTHISLKSHSSITIQINVHVEML